MHPCRISMGFYNYLILLHYMYCYFVCFDAQWSNWWHNISKLFLCFIVWYCSRLHSRHAFIAEEELWCAQIIRPSNVRNSVHWSPVRNTMLRAKAFIERKHFQRTSRASSQWWCFWEGDGDLQCPLNKLRLRRTDLQLLSRRDAAWLCRNHSYITRLERCVQRRNQSRTRASTGFNRWLAVSC